MRRYLKDLAHFSRTERMGAVAVAIAVFLLLLSLTTMSSWGNGRDPDAKQSVLLAQQWAAFERENLLADTGSRWAGGWEDDKSTIPVVLAPFDPNTIDSFGIRRLGLSGRVAKGWIRWRDQYGKRFYDAEDLKPLYNLSPEDWARIAPYVHTSLKRPEHVPFENRFKPYDVPAFVDINTADTTLLDRAIKGVGPTIARRIIQRRDALGGYFTVEQVLDGLRLPDTTTAFLREKLRFHSEKVRRLALNSATPEQLKSHPYIGEKMAGNILLMRNALKRFDNVEQLRQVPLMTGENYRRIAPYFVVD
jgi:DNA uptake protein ComE-like DNA-binding protein